MWLDVFCFLDTDASINVCCSCKFWRRVCHEHWDAFSVATPFFKVGVVDCLVALRVQHGRERQLLQAEQQQLQQVQAQMQLMRASSPVTTPTTPKFKEARQIRTGWSARSGAAGARGRLSTGCAEGDCSETNAAPTSDSRQAQEDVPSPYRTDHVRKVMTGVCWQRGQAGIASVECGWALRPVLRLHS